jgi:hypothetical protein
VLEDALDAGCLGRLRLGNEGGRPESRDGVDHAGDGDRHGEPDQQHFGPHREMRFLTVSDAQGCRSGHGLEEVMQFLRWSAEERREIDETSGGAENTEHGERDRHDPWSLPQVFAPASPERFGPWKV